jgi:glutaredoxin
MRAIEGVYHLMSSWGMGAKGLSLTYQNLMEGRSMSDIIIYTTETCPKCVQLKNVLKSNNVAFTEADMSTPESLTELRLNGVFTVTAPVLQIDDDFLTYEELFNSDGVDLGSLKSIL